jgi:hypothetical protein
MNKELSITEELDFQYLLELLPPLEDTPEFANLPELFSIIGVKSLIKLCKYAGGETITIPTLEQLYTDIQALQYFYDVYIKSSKSPVEIPPNLIELVNKIKTIYYNGMQ